MSGQAAQSSCLFMLKGEGGLRQNCRVCAVVVVCMVCMLLGAAHFTYAFNGVCYNASEQSEAGGRTRVQKPKVEAEE